MAQGDQASHSQDRREEEYDMQQLRSIGNLVPRDTDWAQESQPCGTVCFAQRESQKLS